MDLPVLSSSQVELCNRSSSVLATRNRIAPGALPDSLREHPIWGRLVAQEGSARERNDEVADAHRAQHFLPPALRERKQDDLVEASLPAEYSIVDVNGALSSFVYSKAGGTVLPQVLVVGCLFDKPPYKIERVSALGKPLEHRLLRKKSCGNLRQQSIV